MRFSIKLSAACLFVAGALAVSASSASAVTHHFTCSSAPCIVTGEQEGTEASNIWGITSVAIVFHCNKATYTGTLKSGATNITVHPTYAECFVFGFGATIDTAGCNYVFTGETGAFTNTEGNVKGEDAQADLECEGESTIKVTFNGCTITMKPQENRLGIKYTNIEGTPTDVRLNVTLDRIKYHTNKALACSMWGVPSEGEDTFITSIITLKAYKDTGLGECPKPPDNYSACEGEQVGFTIS